MIDDCVTVAAEAWRFRTLVERQATTRFSRFAEQLRRHGFGALAPMAEQAAHDEQRHAVLCLELAGGLNAPPLATDAGWTAPRFAPATFDARSALIYEVVAQCCVGETESMATLSTLMELMEPSRYRDAVHEIARDEVTHARLGWALLEQEAAHAPPTFLNGHLVAMMRAGSASLYAPAPGAADDDRVIGFGVLPQRLKRAVFEQAVQEVIVPGFARAGLATSTIAEWLTRKQATAAAL